MLGFQNRRGTILSSGLVTGLAVRGADLPGGVLPGSPQPRHPELLLGGTGQQHPTGLGTPSRGLRHLLLLLAPLLKHRALPQAQSHCSQVIKLELEQG